LVLLLRELEVNNIHTLIVMQVQHHSSDPVSHVDSLGIAQGMSRTLRTSNRVGEIRQTALTEKEYHSA
jgi:hypothetical protein